MVNRCVESCKKTSKDYLLHRFPYLDKEVYDICVSRINNPKIKSLDSVKVNSQYRICHDHFSDYCLVPKEHRTNRRLLKARSLPTLNLPGKFIFKLNKINVKGNKRLADTSLVNTVIFCTNYNSPDFHEESTLNNSILPSLMTIQAQTSGIQEENSCKDTDPLEITAEDGLSLFGDSVENIEFVIESDDEIDDDNGIGSKENPIIIHVTNIKEKRKGLIGNQSSSKLPDRHNEIENLDLTISDTEVIKEEIKIEETEIQTFSIEESDEENKDYVLQKQRKDNKKLNTRCFVPNCTIDEKEEGKIYWFKAPADKNLRKTWDICIDRPDKTLTAYDVLCHQHFSENDTLYSIDNSKGVVINATLKIGALPCVEFHKECCVPVCRNKTGPMYTFPVVQTSNFDLWLYMIKNADLKKLKTKEVLRHRVCALHFEPDCFEKDFTLKSTAAPTLYLPVHNINQYGTQSESTVSIGRDTRLCCAYGNCTNVNLTGKKVYKFPQDPDTCVIWLRACKREGLIATPQATVQRMASGRLGVCEDHFQPHCFQSDGSLKFNVVPKFPPGSTSELFRKSIAFSDAQSSNSANDAGAYFIDDKGAKIMPSAFIGICSYRNCYRKVSESNPFFSFPVDPGRSEQWLKACGLMMSSPSSRYQILKNQRICSKHFADDMFESKYKLKPDAVPRPFKKERAGEKRNDNKEGKVRKTPPTKRGYMFDPSKIIFCAVSTCPNNYGRFHGKGKFPDPVEDPARFDMWIKLAANPMLKGLSSEEIYEKYMVCLRHFEPHFYMKDGKVGNLNNEAVPTKFLTADVDWFYNSEYYENRLKKFLESHADESHKVTTLVQRKEGEKDAYAMCVLEESGIRFPSTGHYLYVEKKLNSKRKFPYDVYKFFKTGYGLTNDVTVGENIKIHTAIIIDDDDECERQVLQHLVDKRKKY